MLGQIIIKAVLIICVPIIHAKECVSDIIGILKLNRKL